MISVRNLEFTVAGKRLIHDISFDLNAGEVLAVCGPNGAGKSTLLKCLASQVNPTAGTIMVGNSSLTELTPKTTAKWRAVLPQSGAIPFDFSAREIVLLGRSPHSDTLSTRRDHEIADEAMASTDTSHLAQRTVTTLSGGELQRIHLARVLAQIHDPVPDPGRLLLLDEPTSALDLRHQEDLLQIARNRAAHDTAVFIILHDLNLAARYADRIFILHEGTTGALGTPHEVLTTELLAKVFRVEARILNHPDGQHPLVAVC